MMVLRRKTAGGPAAGSPAPRRLGGRAVRHLALAGLALAAIGLEGCQSGACGPCGGASRIGNGVGTAFRRAGEGIRGAGARIFHHKSAAPAGECCGGGVVAGGVVEGVPIEGAVGGGQVVPGPVISAPADESAPTLLNPLPPAGSGGATGGGTTGGAGGRGAGNRQSFLRRPRTIPTDNRGRGDNLARSALLPSDADGSARGAGGRDRPGPLDNIPPLDLTEDVARRASISPVPPEAEVVKPSVGERPASASATDADGGGVKVGLETSLAPGLKHFAAVKPGLYGGSLPDADGLDWIKDKGIKTIIDLREPNEVDRAFVDGIAARGFRYVSLPISISRLEASHVARFAEETTRTESRPVFFFDADGSRSGLLWYVYRLTSDKVDAQLASREAEELGLADRSTWLAASRFLDSIRPTSAAVEGVTPGRDGTLGLPKATTGREKSAGTTPGPGSPDSPAKESAAVPPSASLPIEVVRPGLIGRLLGPTQPDVKGDATGLASRPASGR